MGWQEDQGAASQSQQLLTSCLNFLRWLICIVPRLWGDYRHVGLLVTCISHHAKTLNSHCAQPGAISTLLHLGLVCDRYLSVYVSIAEEPGGLTGTFSLGSSS